MSGAASARVAGGVWALVAAVVLVWLAAPARAGDRPQILVTDPSAKTYRVAVQRFHPASVGAGEVGQVIRNHLERGLGFSGLFATLDPKAFLGPVQSPPIERAPPPVCDNWRQIGADALLQAQVQRRSGGLRVEFRLLDVSRGCVRLLRKRYRGDSGDGPRIGRAMADDVVAAFTGQPGVFDTEIAFVSTRSGAKEIYVMNVDGTGLRAATSNRSINSFPDWSPSGDAIVYTTYRHRNRPSLFLLTRGRNSPGRLLRNLNSGNPLYRGVFEPSGGRLAIVMSVNGVSEIFSVGRDGGGLKRLTRNRAIDVGPAWSPDGREIAYVSDRGGAPQLYVMNRDGSGSRRLTFNGGYNTSPSWSPDGRWIAYESRVGGQFDIWLIDPDGRTNVPIVEHPRNDEHPSWSPDGRHLAFSSTRRGRADVYVVDVTGKNLRRITDKGENTTPAWGPYRR